ncbi:hypothetical protein [Rhodococcus sp. NPDC047139]|uniref:hypothetical protein n=1 Tax=Rhodococcus sp. NPDC047139 TaxID=3155141 RepID=UPI0033D3303C
MNSSVRLTQVLLVTMSAFQAALAAGAPWGRASYGGKHSGTLPVGLRVASGVASFVYAAGAVTLASPRTRPKVKGVLRRGCVVIGLIGTATNALSPSRPEKVWSAWSLALATSARYGLGRSHPRQDRTRR